MTFLSARLTLLFSTLLLLSPTLAAATTVQFLGLEASGADLQVTVAWSETHEVNAPRLAVRDAKGTEITSIPIDAPPGETVVSEIPGALSAVVEGHRQFLLVVLDDQDKLAAPLPFRIRFDCPLPDVCDFRVLPGLQLTGTIDLAPELAAAIDASKGKTIDLLRLARRQPELRGDVYSYAFDLEHSGTTEASTDGCTCAWTSVTDAVITDCGAYAIFRDGELSRSSIAQSELEVGVELHCNTIEIPERVAVTTPAGTIVIAPPRLVPCATSCIGTVAHGLVGDAHVSASADVDALAEADFTIDWEIDGTLEMSEQLGAVVSLPDAGQNNDSASLVPSPIFRQPPTLARATANADTFVQRLSLSEDAEALSSFHGLHIDAVGHAECAYSPTTDIHIEVFCTNKAIGLLSGDRP